ncbi:MAG: hypothetical protein PHP54_01570 [Clostridia bacterium]|nr:hypothetical protein [Clostridia bacterium]
MKKIIVISVFLILIILLFFRIFVIKNEGDANVIDSNDLNEYDIKKYSNISYSANLLRYAITENYLTLQGEFSDVKHVLMDCNVQSMSDVYFEVCLKGIADEMKYDIFYDISKNNDSMTFQSIDSINLDTIPIGNYLVLLKLNYKVKDNELNEEKANSCYISFQTEKFKELEYHGSNHTVFIKYDFQEDIGFLQIYVSNITD